MSYVTRSLWLLLAVAAVTSHAAGQVHKDEELGFKIRPPRNWRKIPIGTKEKWIVAKYQAKLTLWTKKGMGAHTPFMHVILFPNEITNDKGVEVTKGKGRATIRIKNPYKDFQAWMKDNASQGGYFAVSETERTINKIRTTCIEYKFEKLTTPRRALAWIFHGKDADWAVYMEGIEDYWDKLKPSFIATLKSFRFIKRKGSIIRGQATGGSVVVRDVGGKEKKKSAAERAEDRRKNFDAEVRKARSRLDKSWRVQKSKNYVALTHVDKKYTKYMLDQAEAIRKWLDKHFAWVGEGKPGRAIIRICKDSEEESAFSDSSRDAWGSGFEIVTHKVIGAGKRNYESQWVNSRVTSLWFRDKHPQLSWGMPTWLSSGIRQHLSTGYLKSGRLVFKLDDWDKEQLRNLVRDKKIVSPRKLLRSEDFYKTDGARVQAGLFVRFLLEGPKSRTKDFLKKYMFELLVEMEEDEKKSKEKTKSKKAETEEEQEKRYKELRQAGKKRMERVFDRAFGKWTEARWKKFERSYLEFAGK